MRHPVAVLRAICADPGKPMYQQDLASLVGCSRVYIQKIEQTPEFGGQKISPALAKRIAHETGIRAAWLLNADPTAQPVDQSSKAYTHETFVRWRSDKLKPKPYETAAIALGGLVFYGLLFNSTNCAANRAMHPSLITKSAELWSPSQRNSS